ncbi:rhodanese-like domain-containing protein [Marinitoga litoralis]|uniref:rhodanese-like domain-containing protein n=1 Tax=Marinitoga litoralis TaxID=570855 RepID=UPI001960ACCE|nr:rhodanese-like domain-containing protein [Marinitoga litoralis]MBM7559982.1 rhodanese-related sulfurtransferase [Marinitoga litoralis]
MKKIVVSIIVIVFAILVINFFNSPKQSFQNIDPKEAYELIQTKDIIIIDVRTPGEYNSGHIENSINIDYYNSSFKNELSKLDKNKTYIIYCRSGNRSGKSLEIMRDLGFNNVYNITGGILKWKSYNLPLK